MIPDFRMWFILSCSFFSTFESDGPECCESLIRKENSHNWYY